MNQFITGEGGKKPKPAPWSAVPPVVSLPLTNEPLPKPAPPSANACSSFLLLFCIHSLEVFSPGDKPLPVSRVPMKKETPQEDNSCWGQESASPTVDQEKIC